MINWNHFRCKLSYKKAQIISFIKGRDYETGSVLRASRKRIKQYRQNLIAGDRVLEIGTGSGILSKIAFEKNAKEVVAVDINPAAVAAAKRLVPKAKVIESDLFEKIEGVFDSIIFAPPWSEGEIKSNFHYAIFDCGIVDRFLKEAKDYLKQDGYLWIQYSDESEKNYNNFLKSVEENGYKIESLWSYSDWAILVGRYANIILYKIKFTGAVQT